MISDNYIRFLQNQGKHVSKKKKIYPLEFPCGTKC